MSRIRETGSGQMKGHYSYFVRQWENGFPSLIRLGSLASMEADMYAYPGVWENMPHLNDIRAGMGCFMDYDSVSEEEAAELMRVIQTRYDQIAAEKKR